LFFCLIFKGGDVRLVANVCRVTALLFISVLSACGSGGGGTQASTTVSTNSIFFSPSSPDAPTPTAQTLTATFSTGTVYVTILGNGPAIASTSYTLTDSTAQIVVNPPSPSGLGAGIFVGTVTITAYGCGDPSCSTLTPGNSQIVNVTYQIPPIIRFVAPYVATANSAGTVIIRGQGFQKFPISDVTFGGTAATAFTVISDTEILTSYPPLAAGSYPVQIQAPSSPGTIISQANLVAVDAPSYAATTIAYPSAAPQVKKLVYDAERQALLVAVDTAGGEILRYPFSGSAWGSPATTSINTLSDIALSTDGQHLLALSQTDLYQLKPDTFATDTTTPAPTFVTTGTYFNSLAVGNDGNAVVTTGYAGSTSTALYVYAACNPIYTTCNPAFSQPPTTPTLDNSTAVASLDGSLIAIMQGDPALTSTPGVYQYIAALDTFSATSVALKQNSIAPALSVYMPPNSTSSTTRIVLSGTNASNASVTNVYDASYTLLGTLPSSTLAVVVKPDASRAYTFDSTASQILSFDLTASPAGGAFPQVGSGTTPAGNPGTGLKMAISPDGGTLFLAGSTQIVVQPSPP
jgi:hypothetical protein